MTRDAGHLAKDNPAGDPMAGYRAGARRRRRVLSSRTRDRRDRAWTVARQGALLLKERYGADRVAVFGSLAAGGESFHLRSDVDLAVWGMAPRHLCRAVADLLAMAPDISVDLIRIEEAREGLKVAIERAGVVL